MKVSSKRAELSALTAGVLSFIFFIITWLVGAWFETFAVTALSFQILGGVLIWGVLIILFHQRSLAEREKLDMAQLAKSGDEQATIFASGADRSALFAVAQRRLVVLEKWFVPIFAIVIAVYEISVGFYLVGQVSNALELEVKNPGLAGVFMAAIAFVCFLLSRYATGMSAEGQWKGLRAGASSLLGTAITAFAVSIGLALMRYKVDGVLVAVTWAVPVLLIVVGFETAVNVVLDIYRPRIAGQYSRSAFDSRLLGMINEPGEILHTFAGAIDYQFGFKVSQTWFYRLLEKAVLPLVIFSCVSLYLLSCIVIVNPGEQGVKEHLGKYESILEPGLHWKLPWPFDVGYVHPAGRIQQVNVGFVEAHSEDDETGRKALLWGEEHYENEYDLLVATRATGQSQQEGTVAVSLIRAAIPVQYIVKNVKAFEYNHAEAEKILEAICYREVTHFVASAKIEHEDDSSGVSEAGLLGGGRGQAAKVLRERIQASADAQGLGVEIVFLGLQGIHPPPKVAEDYQNVVGKVQERQAAILSAKGERSKELTALAGSEKKAEKLYDLSQSYQRAKESGSPEEIAQVSANLEAALAGAKGEMFKILSEAESYAFEKATLAEAAGRRFGKQLMAYKASPEIYKHYQRLAMLTEALANIRKYIIVAEDTDEQIIEIDLTEELTPSLYDINIDEL